MTAAWVDRVEAARNSAPVGLVALARQLDVDGTPTALRAISRAFLQERLYRADRPRARADDPQTSRDAAEARRGPARPGGTVHKILREYADHADAGPLRREAGLTSREVEVRSRVKAAHKRTSELLADGLLRVVTRSEKASEEYRVDTPARCPVCQQARDQGRLTPDHRHPDYKPPENPEGDATRGGGRILRITEDGRVELARLNAEKVVRDAERERLAEVRRVRAERRAARG